MTAAAAARLARVLTVLARPRLPHAIVLLVLIAILRGPMVRGQEAASEPARLGTDAINALVARVALYPDPLLLELHADPGAWARKAILNIASSGMLSSDRTLAEYATGIWQAKPCPIP